MGTVLYRVSSLYGESDSTAAWIVALGTGSFNSSKSYMSSYSLFRVAIVYVSRPETEAAAEESEQSGRKGSSSSGE